MSGGVFGLFENGGLAFVLYERTGQPLHLHRGTLLGQAAIRNYRIESGGNFRRHRTRTQHLALREGRLKNGWAGFCSTISRPSGILNSAVILCSKRFAKKKGRLKSQNGFQTAFFGGGISGSFRVCRASPCWFEPGWCFRCKAL